jgi:hypothetical protein
MIKYGSDQGEGGRMIDTLIRDGKGIEKTKDDKKLDNILKVLKVEGILITQTILREVSHHVVHHVARVDHNKGAGTGRPTTNQAEADRQGANQGALIQVAVGMGVGG